MKLHGQSPSLTPLRYVRRGIFSHFAQNLLENIKFSNFPNQKPRGRAHEELFVLNQI